MLRDIHVYGTTKANHRAVLEKLRQLAIQNNTAGASIYDLGNMIKSDSIPEITDVMKRSEEKVEAQKQQEQQHQQQMQDQQLQAMEKEKQLERDYKALEAEKERRNDVLIAEIRASGYGSMMDIDQNQQSDFQDAMQDIRQTEQYQETTQIKKDEQASKQSQHQDKMDLEREKLAVQQEISRDQVNIARENKNKYDKPQGGEGKGKKK
jgi:hypothetical protein